MPRYLILAAISLIGLLSACAGPDAGGNPPAPRARAKVAPATSPAAPNPAYDFPNVDAVLEAIRSDLSNGYERIDARQVYRAFGDAAVAQAAKHLDDPNEVVRSWAGGIMFYAVRESTDADTKRRATRQLVRGLHGDQPMARSLDCFPADAFDEDAKQLLVDQIHKSDNTNFTEPLIIAAGIANVEAIKPDLQRWAADSKHELWWAANLALARMGDGNAMTRVMDHIGPYLPQGSKAVTLPRTVMQLCYTKQAVALEWVIKALESDRVSPTDGDALGFRYSAIAATYLRQVLKMPVPEDDGSDRAHVQATRDWVRANYRRPRLPELLGGELEHWCW